MHNRLAHATQGRREAARDSGHSTDGGELTKDFKAGSDAGAVMYVTKPFKSESLLNAVRILSPAQHVQGD